MKLSDVAAYADMTIFTEIALVIFVTVFLAITVYALRRKNKQAFDDFRHIPLQDAPVAEGYDSESTRQS